MRGFPAALLLLVCGCIGRVDRDGDGFADCSKQYWPLWAYLNECGGNGAETTGTMLDTADTDCPGGCEMQVVLHEYDPANADCNDADPSSYPGATEVCDGVDNDCNGIIDDGDLDCDGDGITTEAGDCDDYDKAIHPGHPEICDGRDNDCNGVVDDGIICP